MKYFYEAKDSSGKTFSGVFEAANRDEVLDAISAKGLYATALAEKEAKGVGQMEINLPFLNRISPKEVVMFSRQLAIMIDSNVSPAEALDALANQTTNKNLKERLARIASDVRGGTALSKAFSRYPEIFSNFYINMVKSAEVSGDLPKILERTADHVESEYDIRSKTMGAMIYPAVILVVFVLIFTVIMVFVIPGLVKVLESTGQELPIATRIIIGVSNFFINQWYLLLILVGGLVAFFWYYPKTKEGKDFFDSLILKIPIFKNFFRNLYLARFAENLSTLIAAGIPIADAMEVIADLIGNNVYRRIILDARNRIIKGEGVSYALLQHEKEITPLFVQMAAVGEKTGRLDSALLNIVRFYKREAEVFIGSLSSIIEPVLLICLAVMVAFLVAAVLLPIYQISTTVPQ
ncbi:MAG: type II secretion system F family protein [Candidatus Pacebacteria bacterium]|nr:type II secretion system F family protein [Candidatus Paceibacterota bacterium]